MSFYGEASSSATVHDHQYLCPVDVRVLDGPVNSEDQQEDEEELTFASPAIKAMSRGRSDPRFSDLVRGADMGQAIQLRLQKCPPKIYPEIEMRRLIDFFQTYVCDWELGGLGLGTKNPIASGIHEAVPPWDFAWTDNYILDPSVPPIDQLQPRPDVNGYKLTDELCANRGCKCEDDWCDPNTCACLRRAAECYPYADSHYQRMFAKKKDSSGVDVPAFENTPIEFVYDDNGRLTNHVPVGTPVFECNDLCGCSEHCTNRVVQKGKKAPLAFAKTEKKGWGVIALDTLPRGTFVGAYGGELLGEKEADYRSPIYEQRLYTTYLQTIDSHSIKVHLTQQIIEQELAEQNKLHEYQGGPEEEQKLVDLITKTANDLEAYDEYVRAVKQEDPDLFDVEERLREREPVSEKELELFDKAKPVAYERAFKKAQAKRERDEEERVELGITLSEPLKGITPDDFDDPIYTFLSLSPKVQAKVREMGKVRSDMEAARFIVIDAALFGNHTRFFNHSCDPNIYHVPVYTHNPSIMRPILAFFTIREVKKDEELCFSYKGDTGSQDPFDPTVPAPASAKLQSPLKSKRNKATKIHAPSAKPGKQIVEAITASAADKAAAQAVKASGGGGGRGSILDIDCHCGAKNCTGKVFY